MPPLNVSRSCPPSWADELRDTVLSPGNRWTAPGSVSIILAARELQGWLTDPRTYEGFHKQGWLSAIADFRECLRQLGPDLRAALGGDLTAADDASACLRAAFTQPGNAAAVEGRLQGGRAVGQQALSRLGARWATPAAREAAWKDLTQACRDPSTRSETLATLRDLFWDLLRAGNYEPDHMSRLLATVLGDSTIGVTEARIWLGDMTEADVTWPRAMQEPGPICDVGAGLTLDEQLALCHRLLTTPPAPGHHVVWIAFDRAGPGNPRLPVGTVTFWDCEWVREVLQARDPNPNREFIPIELKADERLFRPEVLPDSRDVRLARVDLGPGSWTDPVFVAAEQAESVVALAGFHVGDAKWRRLTGYLVAVDGRITRMQQPFSPPHGDQDMATGIYQDSMERELEHLAPQLLAHLPITDRSLSEIVKAVRWWQQARRQPPLAAVLLHVRVLELLSQRASESKWYEYIDRYHRAFWTRRVMLEFLGSLTSECLHRNDNGLIRDPDDQAWLTGLGKSMRTYRPGSGYSLDLKQGLDALPRLAHVFPPHDDLGRRAQGAVARFALPALVSWRDDLVSEWNLTRDRLIRVRNALAHGGPIEDEMADSVHAFARQLAGWSLSVGLEGLLQGQGIAQAHRTRQQRADDWNDGLSSASNVAAALIDM